MFADVSETPLICYGDAATDGPVFERVCPKCRRFVKFPKEMSWKRRLNDSVCGFTRVECRRCGPFEPQNIGWASDFIEP